MPKCCSLPNRSWWTIGLNGAVPAKWSPRSWTKWLANTPASWKWPSWTSTKTKRRRPNTASVAFPPWCCSRVAMWKPPRWAPCPNPSWPLLLTATCKAFSLRAWKPCALCRGAWSQKDPPSSPETNNNFPARLSGRSPASCPGTLSSDSLIPV